MAPSGCECLSMLCDTMRPAIRRLEYIHGPKRKPDGDPDLVSTRGIAPTRNVELTETRVSRDDEVLTPDAIAFIAELGRRFERTRRELLRRRVQRQQEIVAGRMPDFLDTTRRIRAADWRVAPVPPDLVDRRVEITGPVDRKMIINALNSGAS